MNVKKKQKKQLNSMRQISEQLTGCVEARHTEVKREKER